MLESLEEQLRRLDLDSRGNIKTTIGNLRIVNSIRNKLMNIVLNDEYIKDVKEYVNTFREVTKMQNEYWKQIEPKYKPKKILGEIRKQAIQDTVKMLTEGGIGTNITDHIADILTKNITTGGSYRELEKQLKENIITTDRGDGMLERYTKQIATDAINQYSAQVTNIISGDLGAEWYQYQGTDITTTRCFCDAMTDEENKFFHVSEIPRLLRGEGLYCTKDGVRTKVSIYKKTGLPQGMIEGTNPSNFLIYRGGYNCGHQIRPVLRPKTIPLAIRQRVEATPEYQAWKQVNG